MKKIVVVLIGLILINIVLMSGCTENKSEGNDETGPDENDAGEEDVLPEDDTDESDTDDEGDATKDDNHDETEEQQPPVDEFLQFAMPFLQKLMFDDSELRTYAHSKINGLVSSSRECRLNALYRDILKNYTYLSLPLGSRPLQTPLQTIQNKQGTCEDLSILLCSLLWNIDIPSYLVFTDLHVYAMAYDVNTDTLWDCAEQSLILQVEDIFDEEMYQHFIQTISLPPAGVLYVGGDDKTFDGLIDYMTIQYSFQSDQPLHLYIVPTQTDFLALINNGSNANVIYEEPNLTSKSETILQMTTYGGIVLINNNTQTTDVTFDFLFTFQPSFYSTYNKNKLTTYIIEEKNCVLLDPTTGNFGFPGYDAQVVTQKTVINPITYEYVFFS